MNAVSFQSLLARAVSEPGRLLESYRAFHNYSTGNQILAAVQCAERGIPIGPIAPYKRWLERGRCVRKGEKAISLFMPITVKKGEGDDAETFSLFKLAPRWFALSQTDGDTFDDMSLTAWDKSRALTALDIAEIPFDMVNGNVQGFARDRSVAVSPIAQLPMKTLFHEIAHVLLGHTTEAMTDDDATPKSLKEVEAESVAMLCLASLDLPGVEYCRGYIQNWSDTGLIPEKSCRKIMSCTDKILKAGTIGSAAWAS